VIPRSVAGRLYWWQQRMRGRGGVRERLEWLRANQELGAGELAELQFGKLRDLVAHAHRTVPYYRQAMQRVGLCELSSPADLSRLPILTRDLLIRRQADLLSSEADRATLQRNYSSGSTGRRAEFQQDLDFRVWMRAHQLRTYEWCGGWRLGDPFVLLWGSEIYWSLKRWLDRWDNAVSNRREFNTFRLSPALVDAVLDKLVAFGPVLVSSYSNAIHLVAKRAAQRGLHVPQLRSVQNTSEPMPPELRQAVADAFGCVVYDKYGMRETNIVAHESPDHDGMLVQSENVYVEVLDEHDRPCPVGVPGRVVVTALNNRSMPLIRYETTDLACLLPPAAGAPFPRMSHVAGRLQDLVVTPGGDRVDAYLFSYLLMRFPAVHWFQVVQSEPDHLLLRIYAPDGLAAATTGEIVERIHHHTGFPFRVDFELCREMPESATGKFRLTVSALAHTDRPSTTP
jgi:phenylacetate-CoA ligase